MMKKPSMSKNALRGISVFLLASLFSQEIIFAQGTLPSSPIAIPDQSGITRKSVSKKGQDVIINIQDAHSKLGAQESISQILDSLVKNYDLKLIALEGGSGAIDTSIISSFPIEETRRKAATSLMQEGKISAGEFYAMVSGEPVTLYGVDDPALYRENLDVFRALVEKKVVVRQELKGLQRALHELETKINSPELIDFARHKLLHQEGSFKFTEYWDYFSQKAKEKGVDHTRYPNLQKLSQIVTLEKKIDFKKASVERGALIGELNGRLSKSDLEKLILESLRFKQNKTSSGRFHELVATLSQKTGISPESYSNIILYAEYAVIYESIDLLSVLEETAAFENDIREKIFRNDDERQLSNLVHSISILSQLADTTLSSKDYEFFVQNEASCEIASIRRVLRTLGDKYQVPAQSYANFEILENAIPNAKQFYKLATLRNQALMENTLKRMKKSGVHVAALVTGGFHSEGISSLMDNEKLSYLVVMPKFDEKSADRPYITILTRKPKEYEEQFKDSDFYLAYSIASVTEGSPNAEAAVKERVEKIFLWANTQSGKLSPSNRREWVAEYSKQTQLFYETTGERSYLSPKQLDELYLQKGRVAPDGKVTFTTEAPVFDILPNPTKPDRRSPQASAPVLAPVLAPAIASPKRVLAPISALVPALNAARLAVSAESAPRFMSDSTLYPGMDMRNPDQSLGNHWLKTQLVLSTMLSFYANPHIAKAIEGRRGYIPFISIEAKANQLFVSRGLSATNGRFGSDFTVSKYLDHLEEKGIVQSWVNGKGVVMFRLNAIAGDMQAIAALMAQDVDFVKRDFENTMQPSSSSINRFIGVNELMKSYTQATDTFYRMPVEAKWTVLKAVSRMDRALRDKFIDELDKSDYANSPLATAIREMMDLPVPPDAVMDIINALEGSEIAWFSAEMSVIMGGLGRVNMFHTSDIQAVKVFAESLGKHFDFWTFEPFYQYDGAGNKLYGVENQGANETLSNLKYNELPDGLSDIRMLKSYPITVAGRPVTAIIYEGKTRDGQTRYFAADAERHFVKQIYYYLNETNADAPKQSEFEEFFAKAAEMHMLFMQEERRRRYKEEGKANKWKPSVYHFHDGQTALLSYRLSARRRHAKLDLNPESGEALLNRSIGGHQTHTVGNRGSWEKNDVMTAIEDVVPTAFMQSELHFWERLGRFDPTSAAQRTSMLPPTKVSGNHLQQTDKFDPKIQSIALTNGMHVAIMAKYFQLYIDEVLGPGKSIWDLTVEDLPRVRDYARKVLLQNGKFKALYKNANRVDGEADLNLPDELDANIPLDIFTGRGVTEKASGKRAHYENSLRHRVLELDRNVIIYANEQTNSSSKRLCLELVESARKVNAKAAAQGKRGRVVVVTRWNFDDQLMLETAADTGINDCDPETGAAEYTELAFGLFGLLVVAPTQMEGILQSHGVVGRTVFVPSQHNWEGFRDLFEEINRLQKKDSKGYWERAVESIAYARILNSKNTTWELLRHYSRGLEAYRDPVGLVNQWIDQAGSMASFRAQTQLIPDLFRAELEARLKADGNFKAIDLGGQSPTQVYVRADQGQSKPVILAVSRASVHDPQSPVGRELYIRLAQEQVSQFVGDALFVRLVDAVTGESLGLFDRAEVTQGSGVPISANPALGIRALKLEEALVPGLGPHIKEGSAFGKIVEMKRREFEASLRADHADVKPFWNALLQAKRRNDEPQYKWNGGVTYTRLPSILGFVDAWLKLKSEPIHYSKLVGPTIIKNGNHLESFILRYLSEFESSQDLFSLLPALRDLLASNQKNLSELSDPSSREAVETVEYSIAYAVAALQAVEAVLREGLETRGARLASSPAVTDSIVVTASASPFLTPSGVSAENPDAARLASAPAAIATSASRSLPSLDVSAKKFSASVSKPSNRLPAPFIAPNENRVALASNRRTPDKTRRVSRASTGNPRQLDLARVMPEVIVALKTNSGTHNEPLLVKAQRDLRAYMTNKDGGAVAEKFRVHAAGDTVLYAQKAEAGFMHVIVGEDELSAANISQTVDQIFGAVGRHLQAKGEVLSLLNRILLRQEEADDDLQAELRSESIASLRQIEASLEKSFSAASPFVFQISGGKLRGLSSTSQAVSLKDVSAQLAEAFASPDTTALSRAADSLVEHLASGTVNVTALYDAIQKTVNRQYDATIAALELRSGNYSITLDESMLSSGGVDSFAKNMREMALEMQRVLDKTEGSGAKVRFNFSALTENGEELASSLGLFNEVRLFPEGSNRAGEIRKVFGSSALGSSHMMVARGLTIPNLQSGEYLFNIVPVEDGHGISGSVIFAAALALSGGQAQLPRVKRTRDNRTFMYTPLTEVFSDLIAAIQNQELAIGTAA